jgi:hypothetical protein
MKFPFHSLIHFLALFCNYQINSIPPLPNSNPGRLASRNSTLLEVEVTLRLTASQSVSLGVERPSGAHDQIFFTVWHLRSCFCGAPSLTRGWVCLLYMLLALAAQSFSGPSPLELATIFYCLRLETSLFVAFYDSQGHGGGIRPRLHTEYTDSSQLNSYL